LGGDDVWWAGDEEVLEEVWLWIGRWSRFGVVGAVSGAAGTGWWSKPAGGRSDVSGKLGGEEVLVYGIGYGAGGGQFGEKPGTGVYAEAGSG
jgi:hypothetical protein